MAEGMVLTLPIFDPTQTIFDLDPLVVLGMASLAGTISSYFVGAATVGLVWRLFRSRQLSMLDAVSIYSHVLYLA